MRTYKKVNALLLAPLVLALSILLFVPVSSASTIQCNTYTLNGGDEAFLMNLETPLRFGDTVYDGSIYVSPKGTVTFGQGDYTYWDYPQTPSISIAAYDYHAFSSFWGTGNDLYVKYGSTATSVCIDWKVMLWGQSSGEPIYIRLIAYVDPETYTWEPVYQVSSNAPGGARYGVRYETGGEVLPLSIQVITEAPEPEPTSVPSAQPTEEPTPEPTESESPTPEPSSEPNEDESPLPDPESTPIEIEPTPEPSSLPIIEPSPNPPAELPAPRQEAEYIQPSSTPEPQPQATEEEVIVLEEPSSEPTLIENVEPIVTPEVITEEVTLVPEGFVLLSNGVVLEENVVDALKLFDNPLELFANLLSDPSKVLLALSNLGADMSPEVRETSQKVVVTAIIVSQIIGMSVAQAMASGRKP